MEIIVDGQKRFVPDNWVQGVDYEIIKRDGTEVYVDRPRPERDVDTRTQFGIVWAGWGASVPFGYGQEQGETTHFGELGLGANNVSQPNAGQVERSSYHRPSSTGHGHEGLDPW